MNGEEVFSDSSVVARTLISRKQVWTELTEYEIRNPVYIYKTTRLRSYRVIGYRLALSEIKLVLTYDNNVVKTI